MKILRYFNCFLSLSLLTVFLYLPNFALACNCSIPPPCVAYTRADAVFIGKLQKIVEETNNDSSINTTYAYFNVERIFKGKVEKVEVIELRQGNCGTTFRVGEKYFVYRESPAIIRACTRTGLFLEDSPKDDEDFIYASSLSETNPIFNIGGEIPGLNEEEKKAAKVFIKNGEKTYQPLIDIYGTFDFKTAEKGTYNVKIVLPFEAHVEVTSGDVGYIVESIRSEGETTVSYSVKFKPNSCDNREINFSKD